MNSFLVIVILLLVLMLMFFILFYFFTQQSLRDISNRLTQLQPAASNKRSPDTIRRERAYCHDKLVLLEANLSIHKRDSLVPEELEDIDNAQKTIKNCINELKQAGYWIGMPFDFEWTEILSRLPNVSTLYINSALLAPATENTATTSAE